MQRAARDVPNPLGRDHREHGVLIAAERRGDQRCRGRPGDRHLGAAGGLHRGHDPLQHLRPEALRRRFADPRRHRLPAPDLRGERRHRVLDAPADVGVLLDLRGEPAERVADRAALQDGELNDLAMFLGHAHTGVPGPRPRRMYRPNGRGA